MAWGLVSGREAMVSCGGGGGEKWRKKEGKRKRREMKTLSPEAEDTS